MWYLSLNNIFGILQLNLSTQQEKKGEDKDRGNQVLERALENIAPPNSFEMYYFLCQKFFFVKTVVCLNLSGTLPFCVCGTKLTKARLFPHGSLLNVRQIWIEIVKKKNRTRVSTLIQPSTRGLGSSYKLFFLLFFQM